jgi:hypothetical protein
MHIIASVGLTITVSSANAQGLDEGTPFLYYLNLGYSSFAGPAGDYIGYGVDVTLNRDWSNTGSIRRQPDGVHNRANVRRRRNFYQYDDAYNRPRALDLGDDAARCRWPRLFGISPDQFESHYAARSRLPIYRVGGRSRLIFLC